MSKIIMSSSSSSSSNRSFDIGTKSGLTQLYNQPVTKVEHVKRPIAGLGPLHHEGVRVTTDSGDKYLIHKGSDYGKSHQTVVVDASHMSNNWTTKSEASVSDQTVSSFVKEGGKNYNLATDNCQHAAKRMTDLGNK